jgi:N-methylhydantoinase B
VIVTLNLVIGTISKMLLVTPELQEEAMANWCGTSLNVSISGRNDRGRMTICPEASHFAAGCGARTTADGVDTGGIIINTTANIPSVELTEAEYPVIYHFRRQLQDSGGPGRYRGGMSAGVALSPYRAAGPVESSFSGVGAEIPNAYGLAGGLPGATARYIRFVGSGSVPELAATALPGDVGDVPGRREIRPTNSPSSAFPAEDVEYHNWQGGGGYGDPLDRAAERVQEDVVNGAVSPDSAELIYGVILIKDGIGLEATQKLREQARQSRLRRAWPASRMLRGGLPRSAARTSRDAALDGVLNYGDSVRFELRRDEASCSRCGHVLGPAGDDFKAGCLVEETKTTEAGPVRGEEYSSASILRRFYCPTCGRQLEAEVTMPGAPRASFVLAGRTDSQRGPTQQ